METPADALSRLQAAAGWRLFDDRDAHEITVAAANAIVAGVDSPHLRELAGLHRSTSARELRDVAAAAFAEVGLGFPDLQSDTGKLLGLVELCRRYHEGELSARELVHWADGNFDYEAPDEARDLAMLDDDLIDAEAGASWRGTLDQVHRMIDEAVDRVLATYAPASRIADSASAE